MPETALKQISTEIAVELRVPSWGKMIKREETPVELSLAAWL